MGNILSRIFFRPAKAKVPLVMFITGASAGIGKEMALTMIRRGHVVYGAARRVDKMQDLVQAGGHAMALDITDLQQSTTAVQQILKEQGRIDVLVNNAGISVLGSGEDILLERTRKVFEVNFFGVVHLTQQVLPSMRAAKKGLIVNVSSVLGKIYKPYSSTYAGSKHALEGWSDCLRTELVSFGINVSLFEPGFVATDIFEALENITPDGSPYKEEVAISHDAYRKFWPKAAPPSVVADALIHACETSGRPKRRYVMGHMAWPVLFVRNWFGDGVWDILARAIF